MVRLSAACCWVLVVGCQPVVEPPPAHDHDGGHHHQSVVDAGQEPVDAGTCPRFSHLDAGVCTARVIWDELAPGPSPRDHHMTFIAASDHGATLLVTGGIDESRSSARFDLSYTALDAEGLPVGWRNGPVPPVFQTGSAVAMHGARAFVISGKTVTGTRIELTTAISSVELSHTGAPVAWRVERPLPEPRFHATAHTVGRWLFVVGGMAVNSGLGVKAVLRSQVLDGEQLGPWEVVSELPEPRSHHVSFVWNRRLYVLTGLSGSGIGFDPTSYADGLVAEVSEEGVIGAWKRFTLPFSAAAGSVSVLGDSVWVIGGIEGISPSKAVRRAVLTDAGFGPWQTMQPLPFARGHVHHTPVWRHYIYSLGGNAGNHVAVDRLLRGVVE